MYLIINTTLKQRVQLILADQEIVEDRIWDVERKQAEQLLTYLDLMLRQNGVQTVDIQGIGVVTGPGSFSSLRIGITVANTLGFALKLKVVGIKANQFESSEELVKKVMDKLKKTKKGALILPFYNKQPNIT